MGKRCIAKSAQQIQYLIACCDFFQLWLINDRHHRLAESNEFGCDRGELILDDYPGFGGRSPSSDETARCSGSAAAPGAAHQDEGRTRWCLLSAVGIMG